MSWDNVWPLPRPSYSPEELERAVTKALAEFNVKRLPLESYDDWEEEDETPGIAVRVALPVRLLEENDDEPVDDEDHEGLFTVATNVLGDDSERWEVCVHSNDAQNREANMTIGLIAARVSVLLGGPDEPEPL